jgi:hypothetical protein
MGDPTSRVGKARTTEPLACYGVVFVARSADLAADLLDAPSMSLPQLASPGLDSSFLIGCQQVLTGKKVPKDLDRLAVRRVAGTRRRGSTSIHLFACSSDLRNLLASLSERRARELAIRWPTLAEAGASRECDKAETARPGARLDGHSQHRVKILTQLVGLSRIAKTADRSLMLRVEYHRRRRA